MNQPDMHITVGGVVFKNPVLTASGTFGYGKEFEPYVNLHHLGGVVVKGISLAPRRGNPPPRIVETAGGMLNAIGLENVGLDRFISEKIPYLKEIGTRVIVNILGDSLEEYQTLAQRLSEVEGISGLEVNISCPNVKKGGVAFGTDPAMAEAVTRAVCTHSTLPVIVKLSPNVTDISQIARAVEAGGAQAVSLINTLLGMAIDVKTRRPRLANVVGGLSGPAIKPIALRMVWQVAQAVKIPVIGIGGITTTEDALEFLLAGATAIEVGTANFVNPRASQDIVEGLARYLTDNKLSGISEVIGGLVVP
ncbi:MAG: dihydroorotate dehydrogenase [Desulfobulbaceae bacterium]|nr:dihydroorotate dehydrogenase [Desulfobulbaceae bacterium]HIJ89424.1 dihydroorotate dehydrogenase [Deltaproteobacteria bacterium]